jgi:Cu/Ag efflux pump CusA
VADVEGRDVDAVVRDVQDRLAAVSFPLEYHAETVGDYTERQTAHRRALAVLIAAALAAFLVLQAALSSWRLAAMAAAVVPAGLAGGALAILVTGRVISLGSLVGLLAVVGIGARHAIGVIRGAQLLVDHDGELDRSVVLRATHERVAPVVATTAAAIAGLLPLALSSGVPGEEILHPMAIVLLGGLTTSALFALLVLPDLLLRFGRRAATEAPPTAATVSLPDVDQVPGG